MEICTSAIFLITETQKCFFTTIPPNCLWMLLGMTVKPPHLQNKTQGIHKWSFFLMG